MMAHRLQVFPGFAPGYQTRVRLLIQHPMETGFRHDLDGNTIPKNVIQTLSVEFAGQLVFKASLGTGISADPFLEFGVHTPQSGELQVRWIDDMGHSGEARHRVVIAN
jgi:sulfur-oxidizing protein SoxZ